MPDALASGNAAEASISRFPVPGQGRSTIMELHVWATFALASLVIALIPGPGVASIIGFAFSSGQRAALASVAGMALGNALAMTMSLLGAGAILATSALAFTILKLLGAAYLIAIGIVAIVKSGNPVRDPGRTPPISPRAAFLTNVAVGTLHPKTILFFIAFASQFVSPDRPYLPQLAILVATFTGIAACTDSIYALAAARASGMLARSQVRIWAQRVGGGVLVAAGLATAMMRR
jgi:threonine/homoserine/homoserine lactone efflux protein